MNRNISRVFNLVWESLHQGLSPALKPYLFFYNIVGYGSYISPEYASNTCDLEETFNGFNTWRMPRNYNPFQKPNTVMIAIFTETSSTTGDDWQYFQHYPDIFSTFCVILVGNPGIADNITQSVSCVWRVDTFEELSNLTSSVIETLDSNACFVGNLVGTDDSCPMPGAPCLKEYDCPGRTLSCIDGTCQSPNCSASERVPNYQYDYDYYDYYYSSRVRRSNEQVGDFPRKVFKSRRNALPMKEPMHEGTQKRQKREKKTPAGESGQQVNFFQKGSEDKKRREPPPSKTRSGFNGFKKTPIKHIAKPGKVNTKNQPPAPESNSESKEKAMYNKHLSQICKKSKPTFSACQGVSGSDKENCIKNKDGEDQRCEKSKDVKPAQESIRVGGNGIPKLNKLPKFGQSKPLQFPEILGQQNKKPVSSKLSKGSSGQESVQGNKRKMKKEQRMSSFYYPEYFFYKELESSGCCEEGLLQCSGVPGMCLYGDLLCDGVKHCINGEDEDAVLCATRECAVDEFRCSSGQCIEASGECDGQQQCSDGSDEHCGSVSDCPSPRSHYCSSGECIYPSFVCDNIVDCQDGEDEKPCSCTGFKCDSGESVVMISSNESSSRYLPHLINN